MSKVNKISDEWIVDKHHSIKATVHKDGRLELKFILKDNNQQIVRSTWILTNTDVLLFFENLKEYAKSMGVLE